LDINQSINIKIKYKDMNENIVPVWETCKENVLPIKRGRSIKGLSQVLSSNQLNNNENNEDNNNNESINKYETSLKNALEKYNILINNKEEDVDQSVKNAASLAVLDVYIQYFKW
jgi:hypothetical protein